MSKLFMALINFYRKYLSGLKRHPTCKYYPTCSEYGYECVRIHGWFIGSFLALWRILRCNPFSRGGVDYPPEKKIKMIRPKGRP